MQSNCGEELIILQRLLLLCWFGGNISCITAIATAVLTIGRSRPRFYNYHMFCVMLWQNFVDLPWYFIFQNQHLHSIYNVNTTYLISTVNSDKFCDQSQDDKKT